MLKFASIGIFIFAFLTACFSAAQAAEVELPPDSIGADTVFVIRADARHLTPDSLRTALLIVLGENAERTNDFVAKFRDRYDRATHAGLESITVIGTSTQCMADAETELGVDANANVNAKRRSAPNPPVVYFHLKAGGDAKAVEQVMTEGLPPKQREDARFEPMDNWLVMHQKNQTPPEKPDVDCARAFAEALGTTGDSAVGMAFIPDAKTQKDMNAFAKRDSAPKLAKEMLPALATSKWITLAIALGNNPGLTAKANTIDAPSARQINDAVSGALDDLLQSANGGNNAGAMIFLGPILKPLAEGLRPISSGNMVSVKLTGEPLNLIANLIVTFRFNGPPATRPAGE